MSIDLNCDLGEGEPFRRTEALLRRVTSCNIACGVHAGSMESMERGVDLALRHQVRVGAHPGAPGGFGRGDVTWSATEFSSHVVRQVTTLMEVAQKRGAALHHVKLHGALYHRTEQDPVFTTTYLKTMAASFPGTTLFAATGGRVAAAAPQFGVTIWEEAFLDRGYRPDGTLIPRGDPGAMIACPRDLRRRLDELLLYGAIVLPEGAMLRARTFCLHGDHPASIRNAGLAAQRLAGRLD